MTGDRFLRRIVWMRWAALAACGPLALAGCGGSDEPAPTATASAADAGPGAHGGDHGAPGGHGMPGGHDATAEGPQGGPSVPMPGAHDPAGNAAAQAPTGGFRGESPAAHEGNSAQRPGAHGQSASAYGQPTAGHGQPGAGHGQPGQAHGVAGSTAGATAAGEGDKLSTGEWLGGLAAGVFDAGAESPSGPGMPPGAVQPAAGHGIAGPGYDASGNFPPGFTPPGEIEGAADGTVDGAGGIPAQPKQFEEGTAEYAVQQFVLKVQKGDTSGLDKLISEKTNDKILAPLRDGTAEAELLQKGQALAAGATLLNVREGATSKTFTVRNAVGQTLTITARREDNGDYKVASLRIEDARGRRR